jgi:hypothetical protein
MSRKKFGRQKRKHYKNGVYWKQRKVEYIATLLHKRLMGYMVNTKEFQEAVSNTIAEFARTGSTTVEFTPDGNFKQYKGEGKTDSVFTPLGFNWAQSEKCEEV